MENKELMFRKNADGEEYYHWNYEEGYKPIFTSDFANYDLFFKFIKENLSIESINTFCKSVNKKPSDYKQIMIAIYRDQSFASKYMYYDFKYYNSLEKIALSARENNCEYVANIQFHPENSTSKETPCVTATGLIPKQKISLYKKILDYMKITKKYDATIQDKS